MGVAVHEPDAIGIWCEDNEMVWLPRSFYPKRIDAIQWAMDQWNVPLPEVRCRSRWMRYAPRVVGEITIDGITHPGWTDDWWVECGATDDGAFRVWRLESA